MSRQQTEIYVLSHCLRQQQANMQNSRDFAEDTTNTMKETSSVRPENANPGNPEIVPKSTNEPLGETAAVLTHSETPKEAQNKDKVNQDNDIIMGLSERTRYMLEYMNVIEKKNGVYQRTVILDSPIGPTNEGETPKAPEAAITSSVTRDILPETNYEVSGESAPETTHENKTEMCKATQNEEEVQPSVDVQSTTTTGPETPAGSDPVDRSTSPVLHFGPSVSSILTDTVVWKILRMNGVHSRDECRAIATKLDNKIKELLILGDNLEISNKKLQKIAKSAAKSLVLEYGSLHKLLGAARKLDEDFEADVVKHVNSKIRAYLNRPKSIFSRFLSLFH